MTVEFKAPERMSGMWAVAERNLRHYHGAHKTEGTAGGRFKREAWARYMGACETIAAIHSVTINDVSDEVSRVTGMDS